MDSVSIHLLNNNDVKRRKEELSFRLQLAYGVGHVLNDICASIWFTYLLIFFTLVLKFDNREAGTLLLIGQIADGVANPFVGYYSDRVNSFRMCRYGKRKIWHLFGSAAIICTFPFIFLPCLSCTDGQKWTQLVYFSVLVLVFQFGWASVQISHLSLIPDLTPNDNCRTRLTAIRYCFTVISNILVYTLSWGILGLDDDSPEVIDAANDDNPIPKSHIGPEDASKFQSIVWACLSFGVVCTVIFHLFIKEKRNGDMFQEEIFRKSKSFCEIFSNYQYYQCALIHMSTMLFVNLSQIIIPLYLNETLGVPASSLAIIPLIIYLGSFAASTVVEKLNTWFGRKIAYTFGTIFGVTALIWIKLRSNNGNFIHSEIYIAAVFIGIGAAIILVTNLGITADLIGAEIDSGGFIFSIMTFTDKLANGIVVFVIQDLHKDFPSKLYYENVLVFVCGGVVILATLAVIFLRREKVLEIIITEKEGYILIT